MKKTLAIDNYLNGYNVSQLDCLDLALAGAAGSYHYDYYHYYCFYYSFYHNWTPVRVGQPFEVQNRILGKLGLVLKDYPIASAGELIAAVRSHLDRDRPVIVIVKYNTLFYDSHYQDPKYQGSHGLLISGYDDEKSLVYVREFIHVRSLVRALTMADALAELPLPYTVLGEAWEQSNAAFQSRQPMYHNRLFAVEDSGVAPFDGEREMLEDFLAEFDPDRNQLAELVRGFNDRLEGVNDRTIEAIRTDYYGSLRMLFDGFERLLKDLPDPSPFVQRLIRLEESMRSGRKRLISKLHAEALRKQQLGADEIEWVLRELSAHDQELTELARDLAAALRRDASAISAERGGSLVNLALAADVAAESEERPASYAVTPGEDSWRSDPESTIHWLRIDLGRPRTVVKFIVNHFGRFDLNTRDFEIQGSHDGQEWVRLATVCGNILNRTEHPVLAARFRFFRLYITYACLKENRARIMDFQALGLTTEDGAEPEEASTD